MSTKRLVDDYQQRMEEVFVPQTRNQKKPKKTPKKGKNKMNASQDMILVGGAYVPAKTLTYAQANASPLLTGDDVVNIKTKDSKRNRGYIFYMQKDLQAIYEKSGVHAHSNEFQVHYWFLNFRYKAPDESIIDIAIPTCYFNYEQFVTGTHVDFELKDVGPLSEKVMPLHNLKVNELMAMGLEEKINALFENKLQFEAMSVNFGTLHRHPGQSASQSFSGTDLNTNVKTEKDALGVVFPLADAEDDKPSFSAIIALDSAFGSYYNATGPKTANLAHCEYRNANGKIQEELVYEKNRCIAFSIIKKDEPSTVEKLFGIVAQSKSQVRYSNTENKLFDLEVRLLEIFEEIEKSFEASTLAVLEANVKLPVSQATTAYNAGFKYADTKKETIGQSHYHYQDAFYESDEPIDTESSVGGTAVKKLAAATPHEKYLVAKTELTKIHQNNAFISCVKEYASIENETNHLGSLPVSYAVLEKLLNDFNKMSELFYGKSHKDEEIRFYSVNNIVDYRDIRDFLNENINLSAAILEDTAMSIQLLIDYENADTANPIRNKHLYANPFLDLKSTDGVEVVVSETETTGVTGARVAPEDKDMVIEDNTQTESKEPEKVESEKTNHILSAVKSFMTGGGK